MPHPYLVPTRPSESRSTHNSGVSDVASTEWDLPLTLREYLGMRARGRCRLILQSATVMSKRSRQGLGAVQAHRMEGGAPSFIRPPCGRYPTGNGSADRRSNY